MVYATPAIVGLVAAGTPQAWDWLSRRHRLAPAGLVLLFLPPLVASGYSVAFPWIRADTAGAAAYVATHRQPDDVVAGNDWTHAYYFRRLGPAFQVAPATEAQGDRCWVVYTEECPKEKRLQDAVNNGPAGWVAVEQREFTFTTVLLLQRPEKPKDEQGTE